MKPRIVLAAFSILLGACGGDPFLSMNAAAQDAGQGGQESGAGGSTPEGGSGGLGGALPEAGTGGSTPDAQAGSGGGAPDAGAGGSTPETGTGGTGGSFPEGGSGGQDAAAGSSGTGPEAGAETDAPDAPACPAGDMVQVGSYCIDKTEVTRDAYALWLATNPSVSSQEPWCTWNTTFVPSCEWPPGSKGSHPVACVNWCQAFAYCKGVGKRLCGKIGGGSNGFGDAVDASKSQWFNACSSGGHSSYPYGGTYDPQACNTADKGIGGTTAVGSLPSCQGGQPGIFDLSGNVWEWEDSCDGAGKCQTRGGSFNYNSAFASCGGYHDGSAVEYQGPNVGLRCCS